MRVLICWFCEGLVECFENCQTFMWIFIQSYLRWIARLTFVVKIWGIFPPCLVPLSLCLIFPPNVNFCSCMFLIGSSKRFLCKFIADSLFSSENCKKITLKLWDYISSVTKVFFIFSWMNGRDICPRRDGRWWTVWDISQETLNICVSPPRKREYCPGGQNKCSTKTFCRGNLFLSIILFGQTLHRSRETQHNE